MDARLSPRVSVDSLAVLETDRDEGCGALLDLSHGGARLSSAYPVHLGDYLSLTFSLSAQVPPLEVMLAAVRWVQRRQFGVEFLRVPDDERRRLQEFLEKCPAAKPTP